MIKVQNINETGLRVVLEEVLDDACSRNLFQLPYIMQQAL